MNEVLLRVLQVIFSASIAFLYLLIISKLLGKKQIAELDFITYVTGISIGSIAAEMSTNAAKEPLYLYLISMTVFFLFDFLIGLLTRKGLWIEKLLIGSPIIIIENGKINFKALKKSKLTLNEITAFARDKGIFSLGDIAYGIFESNGKFSIIPKAEKSPLVAQDLKVKKEKASLPLSVIVDGKISKTALGLIGKDKDWLYKKLDLNKQKQKMILLAEYDQASKEFTVFYKDK
ncbi:MAG TPA: YetF domain-containing protein [Clostridia bacterium]